MNSSSAKTARQRPNPQTTTVFILAAGLGTRLRPITDTVPKVMVPMADGRPLLEHTIGQFKQQGFLNFVINLHYLPEVITNHFGNGSRFGVYIQYSDERDVLLEVGGALRKAAPLLSDPFIMIYGDHVHRFDLTKLLAAHTKHGGVGTITLKPCYDPQAGELAQIDLATNRITHWYNRPHNIQEPNPAYRMNTGFNVLSTSVLDYIPANTKISLDREVLGRLINDQKLPFYGFPTDEKILDIGTPEKYELAKRWLADERISK